MYQIDTYVPLENIFMADMQHNPIRSMMYFIGYIRLVYDNKGKHRHMVLIV